jgi:hypothetical protein
MKLIPFLLLIAAISCRCQTDFTSVHTADNPVENTINVTARMWQGQFEYLAITITINRTDSLFVKDIIVKPSLGDRKFFPAFDHYTMYSFYYSDEENTDYKGQAHAGYFWKDYTAKAFQNLPVDNRKTNKGSSFVSYTVNYNSEQSIDFERFFADIEVVLEDKAGDNSTLKNQVEFRGKKKCNFSVH